MEDTLPFLFIKKYNLHMQKCSKVEFEKFRRRHIHE